MPPQHGAWAFLGLPVATAATVAPSTPVLALLVITWVAAFPPATSCSPSCATAAREGPTRVASRAPSLWWWGLLLVGGVPLLVLRPWLIWVALLYLASFAVNVAYARRHDERALGNDLVFIAAVHGDGSGHLGGGGGPDVSRRPGPAIRTGPPLGPDRGRGAAPDRLDPAREVAHPRARADPRTAPPRAPSPPARCSPPSDWRSGGGCHRACCSSLPTPGSSPGRS